MRARSGQGWRLWLLAVGGLVVGLLLCTMPLMWESAQPPQGAPPAQPPPVTSSEVIEEPTTLVKTPSPFPSPSATSPSPSVTPAVTPTVTPAVTTPGPVQSTGPALLGPATEDGLENLVQRYCDRHTGGSADDRSDGSWRCRRLLTSSSVDMNVACRDTYGSGAFARTSDPDDAYAWRCYR